MSWVMWEVSIGDLQAQLRESPSIHGRRFTMVLSLLSDPREVSITYLGNNLDHASHLFARKVEVYRAMAAE